MNAEKIALALGCHKAGQSWMARCPAHDDHKPSLSITDAGGKVLVHCHAGCDQHDVISALRARGLWSHKEPYHCRSQRPPYLAPKQLFRHDTRRGKTALSIWEAAVPTANSLVENYFSSRGLNFHLSSSLRFHRGLKHPSGGVWPSIVSRVTQGSDATLRAIHRTFLDQDGARKAPVEPAKMMLGPCAGGSVRLSESVKGPLVVCEGIETGLSLLSGLLRHPASVWAALSTGGMKALELPSQAGELIVATDGDDAGRKAGNELAMRATALGWRVSLMPAPTGLDWNDVLQCGSAK